MRIAPRPSRPSRSSARLFLSFAREHLVDPLPLRLSIALLMTASEQLNLLLPPPTPVRFLFICLFACLAQAFCLHYYSGEQAAAATTTTHRAERYTTVTTRDYTYILQALLPLSFKDRIHPTLPCAPEGFRKFYLYNTRI